ncbi:GntR family transcriptional regulator [Streptosporangium becharense]|uniref:GntR family transcriptional regulator n=1 Tax=Streptosporangium becharense TaxID=1816182 RepID=A0A7W9IC56_9ACTN|nr:GntR family transcriptional regulator [Streptosporangium becharense]MBB2910738.1 GntR family transcriptional regulator [Streptosporangium becharense]MBB5817433.1 GntR family transcriptional regulator [Streptosporangium becharense]
MPLHAQISEQVRARIATGEWPPHYRLPPEPDLAGAFGVSRGTLRRAMQTLLAEGLLVQIRGRGTFVTSAAIEPSIAQKLHSLSEDFAQQGIPFTTEVLDQRVVPAPRPVAALLDLPQDTPLFLLRRRRHTASGPVALFVNYVRVDVCPGIEEVDFSTETLFATIEGKYGLRIETGRRTFSAQAADGEVAAALGMAPGRPVLYLEQVTYLDDRRPVEYSDVWIDSDLLKVSSLLTRR